MPSPSVAPSILVLVLAIVVVPHLAPGQCDQAPSYPLGEWSGPCTGAPNCADWHIYETPISGVWVSVTGPGTFTQDVPLAPGVTFTGTFVVASPPYESIVIATVSADGCSMSGTWSDSNGASGTFERTWFPFTRGDANDDGTINIADPVTVLNALFPGSTPGAPIPCADAMDGNDDGALDVADPVYILNYLFLQGAPIPPPTCAGDPTPDTLTCEEFAGCP